MFNGIIEICTCQIVKDKAAEINLKGNGINYLHKKIEVKLETKDMVLYKKYLICFLKEFGDKENFALNVP